MHYVKILFGIFSSSYLNHSFSFIALHIQASFINTVCTIHSATIILIYASLITTKRKCASTWKRRYFSFTNALQHCNWIHSASVPYASFMGSFHYIPFTNPRQQMDNHSLRKHLYKCCFIHSHISTWCNNSILCGIVSFNCITAVLLFHLHSIILQQLL